MHLWQVLGVARVALGEQGGSRGGAGGGTPSPLGRAGTAIERGSYPLSAAYLLLPLGYFLLPLGLIWVCPLGCVSVVSDNFDTRKSFREAPAPPTWRFCRWLV